jgi:hypothetical protein
VQQLRRRVSGFTEPEIHNVLLIADLFACVSVAALARIYDLGQLDEMTQRNAIAIGWEAHHFLGTASPKPDATGRLPDLPDWPPVVLPPPPT